MKKCSFCGKEITKGIYEEWQRPSYNQKYCSILCREGIYLEPGPERDCLMKLCKAVRVCPKRSEIPKHWHEAKFNFVRVMAKIIRDRLQTLIKTGKAAG